MGRLQFNLHARWLAVAAVLATATSPLAAQDSGTWSEVDFGGYTEAEVRYFPNDAAWPGQSDAAGLSLATSLEFRWYGENQRSSFQPYMRWDSADSERSHFDLREAYWAMQGDDWELLAGFNKVFWGVTESRHLVDIINQTDMVEDPDQEQKLGQAMLNFSLRRDWGDLDLFIMPWFRERTFPGIEGRLRAPVAIDPDAAIYESSADRAHTDVAVRWSHYFGDLDIGLSTFHGTGREPLLIPGEEKTKLQPFYHQITQFGLDAQYTRDAWLWKFEAIVRDGWRDTFGAAVAGFEYTVYGLRESALDLGLIFEYLYDDRGPTEPITTLDDDLFLGTRLAFNDVQDTSILSGIVVDRNSGEWFLSVEAERRLGGHYMVEATIRLFNGNKEANQLFAFDQDDYVQFSIKRYF